MAIRGFLMRRPASFILALNLLVIPTLGEKCTKRMILTDTEGSISDGQGSYEVFSRCEWLIDAQNPNKSILLEFQSMDTECSFDYIFVFDGDSYSSPKLASLSGMNNPQPILATSGKMLIYLFSDRNYNREGFVALYSIQECPYNCHNRGACIDHVCYCDSRFTGRSCETEICPNDCGEHGHCGNNSKLCECDENYSGYLCNIFLNDDNGSKIWYDVAPENSGFTARTSHAGTFVYRDECLYIFGGYTLNEVLGDLVRFCMRENRWETLLESEPWPEKRREHAVCEYEEGFFMFGGILDSEMYMDDLWYYNITSSQWTLMAVNSTVRPHKLSGHSLTRVDDWIYIFGGKTEEGEFSSDMYKIDGKIAEQWEKVDAFGGKPSQRRLVGHSAVYHKESRSLLIYGGYSHTLDQPRFGTRIDTINAFNVDDRVWSVIYFSRSNTNIESIPIKRAFHTAAIFGNYMVVYGGNTHSHHEIEICYDKDIYIYHLGCHIWLSVPRLLGPLSENPLQGRFGHVATVAYDNMLLVVGGFSGYVRGDFKAFKFPASIVPPLADRGKEVQYCAKYSQESCQDNPECMWCDEYGVNKQTKICIHRSQAVEKQCYQNPYQRNKSPCPGICAFLVSCVECLSQGRMVTLTNTSSKLLFYKQQCSWCVKEQECQIKTDPQGTCLKPNLTKSGKEGWWGGLSASLLNLDQCPSDDYPAGLHSITYNAPMNLSHPDKVKIIHNSSDQVIYSTLHSHSGYLATRWMGFIYPLDMRPKDSNMFTIKLKTSNASTVFNLSRDYTRERQETVASITASTQQAIKAERADKSALFNSTNVDRSYKYYMELNARLLDKVHTRQETLTCANSLFWNGGEKRDQLFYYEFLEPFNTGMCHTHDNCMACMTDTACGWCTRQSQCVRRTYYANDSSTCFTGVGTELLITDPEFCPVCSDYVDCQECTQNYRCEWNLEYPSCIRRGRLTDKFIRKSAECPEECHSRKSCSDCIMEKKCAWCENLHTCLPFSDYVSRHLYGQCTEWIDNEGSQLPSCRNCSMYDTCDRCIKQFNCGWCANEDNPTYGRCVDGDFSGPDSRENCSALISQVSNISASDPASWSYQMCPDVDECRLGLDNCHVHATCINTYNSFYCQCNKGYMGVGGTVCNKTCFHECEHGRCSGPPDYQCICDLGWTAENCAINCGCNNHSTCLIGVGICDECQNGTTGEFCDSCLSGYYGDPALKEGCYKCECNGHGDPQEGICHNGKGECFCIHNTRGFYCHECMDGFYGDPSNGGKCYRNCDDRVVLNIVSNGALGTYKGSGVKSWRSHCLWILTVFKDITVESSLDINIPHISLEMESVMTECGRDYIYVYDGIPEFISGYDDADEKRTLLGAFCGGRKENIPIVTAVTGKMTIYFSADISGNVSMTRGFNATYHVDVCDMDSVTCACMEGYELPDCVQKTCPQNCTYQQAFDSCNCKNDFGGEPIHVNVFPWNLNHGSSSWEGHRNQPIGRYGHTLTSCGDSLYLFGGYSFELGLMDDIWRFDPQHKQWHEMIPIGDDLPVARYYHAAACVPILKTLYIFGGFVSAKDDGQLKYRATNELWKFAVDARKWTKINVPTLVMGLAGHSLTLVENTNLVVIGGFSTEHYFSDHVYEYNTTSFYINSWQQLSRANMQGAIPLGMYGHSAVYDEPSRTIYIYGGMVYRSNGFKISSSLYTYDTSIKRWSTVPEVGRKLEPSYFHTAVSLGNYMVVIGGKNNKGNLSNNILIYKYTCNFWQVLSMADNPAGLAMSRSYAPSATVFNNSVYVFGGLNDVTSANMFQLSLPLDICEVNGDVDTCVSQIGCTACVVTVDGISTHDVTLNSTESTSYRNKTICSSNANGAPPRCVNAVSVEAGRQCNISWFMDMNCTRFRSCSECIAVYPQFKSVESVCKWCSNCPGGHCVAKDDNCEKYLQCKTPSGKTIPQREITNASECIDQTCAATTCDACVGLKCMWTRNFNRKTESLSEREAYPVADWNCFSEGHRPLVGMEPAGKFVACPPDPCPDPCYKHTTCSTCLESAGAEGSSRECVWSVILQECMALAYLTLHCSGGECGTVLQGDNSSCPRDCSGNTKCADCMKTPGCGWCAFGEQNGNGICMPGGLVGPSVGQCNLDNVTYGDKPMSVVDQKFYERTKSSPPTWSFSTCPLENECDNNHHNCDVNYTQDCVNTDAGFNCQCKKGYFLIEEGNQCKPECHQGCSHGTCVSPDKCQCHFGYVKDDCSVKCRCNENSNCKSEKETDDCLQCMNNTQGLYCQECKPLFVGNPSLSIPIPCKSCTEYCNNHTDFCFAWSNDKWTLIPFLMEKYNYTRTKEFLAELSLIEPRGPEENSAVCFNCQHHTKGKQCQDCEPGYFRLSKTTDPCTKCMCNGHSDTCDIDGVNCHCQNNTESRCGKRENKEEIPCYRLQCSACKEYFMGTPTKGHQCYRQMSVNREYCFDPTTQTDCSQNPGPLQQGRTVFFGVQPKYVNVDIRITIDVTKGGIDVYFSPSEMTFMVDVDKKTGVHNVKLDSSIYSEDILDVKKRKRRSIEHEIHKREANASSSWYYYLNEIQAKDMNTFITVSAPGTILIIRDVKYRLVITLPNEKLDLRTSKFYIVFVSRGADDQNETYGSLYFRQDQPHIDLFVFFSVFFSCFFLFLAMCVLLWKTKQVFDSRRSRQQRAREMQHMASRPFAKVLVLIEHSSMTSVTPPTQPHKKTHMGSPRTRLLPSIPDNVYQSVQKANSVPDPVYLSVQKASSVETIPIAIEPLDDGIAAVGTVMFQLPGGAMAPSMLCLGSTLTMRVQTGAPSSKNLNRCRTSSSVC
ncbi:hypothetical protein CHS0354_005627 [Potamilus streckersoni]|uniref:Multiple epidermal growth factor-like domains protein 8 n=1 Tax=Potamilus streckersoni TaxID=2493646 RepID=A0AAE0VTB5_9BIVA|nr:hypothetical protein CHS0354_005627 [Potamilus streckersoni]